MIRISNGDARHVLLQVLVVGHVSRKSKLGGVDVLLEKFFEK